MQQRASEAYAQPHGHARAQIDPSWRHTRALEHVEAGIVVLPPGEDPWVKRLVAFLHKHNEYTIADALARLGDEASHHQTAVPDLEAYDQIVYWAYWIFVRSDEGPRYQLEALLLTRLPDQEIVGKLAVPAAVVSAYEHLFFDVRR